MKTFLLAGVVALVVLLALPMAVSAGNNSAVTVSGTINLYMDVSVSPSSTQFFTMSAFNTSYNKTAVITTNTSSDNWHVDASNQRVTQKGFMNRTLASNLTNPFQLSKDNVTFSPLTADYLNFMQNTTTAGSFTQIVYQKQAIGVADPDGIYNLIVTLIGIAS